MVTAISHTPQACHYTSTLELVMFLLIFGTTIDLITTFSSEDPRRRNGRAIWWVLSPLPGAFAMVYRKITGVAAPIWMPWTVGLVICAAAMLAAHYWR